MKHFEKILTGVPVGPILWQLDANPQLWDQNSIRKTAPGTPHSGMSDIWVRYKDVAPHKASGDYSTFCDEHVPVWYEAWKALPALRPFVMSLMTVTEGEMLGGVLITRIPSGAGIGKHVDKGWHVEYYDKFYLSLRSEWGSRFYCQDGGVEESINPVPGDVWLFDNRKEHWVENNSGEDRITLIVCIRTEKYGRTSCLGQ
jgi:hypothetical protein